MKKIFYFGSTFVLLIAIIEIIGFASYYIIFGKTYSKQDIKHQIRLNAGQSINDSELRTEAGDIFWGDQVEVIHPYLGFTQDPKRNIGVSSLGFPSLQLNQYIKKDPNKIIIALMGGSFAREIYFLVGDNIVNLCSEYFNKEIILLNFAVGGYKQPQQLIALNYLLMSGAEFDIVINVDGFNEIALPVVENIKYGVSPFYPRMWINRVKNLYDPSEIRLIGKIEAFKSFKRSLAYFFNEKKLYRSPALSLIWQIVDRKFDGKIASANIEMRGVLDHAVSFAATGPEYKWDSEEKLYSDLSQIWLNSSVMMNNICRANGIEYYHVLQPNQYVPNSKILSSNESKYAYDPNHPYRDPVLKGYSFLRENGKLLSKQNIHFIDLADIFKENSETFYKDTCCHLNTNGYLIVVEKILEYIKKESKVNQK
ncbi:MAG: hypothetical protein HQK63_04560 [Desulfamplus sp.]|nr:hypothetical protein [Desulfamplus sp.]